MLITVRVHARASRERVLRSEAGLEVWVHAAAADGAANRAVLQAVAKELGVPGSAVSLRTGARARVKLIEVAETG